MVRPAQDTAISTATLSLLAEVGYDCMTMDAVAARARASKATIYRHWPGKRELVLHALRSRAAGCTADVDAGSLRDDLVHALTAASRTDDCDEGRLMAGVMRAMRESSELTACMRDQVFERKHQVVRAVVARAVARGELAEGASAEVATEVAGALWVQRVLLVGAPVDDAFVVHVVDDVLIPLLVGATGPTPDPSAAHRPTGTPCEHEESP